jgi:hypothetical protein|tara:strand:- start:1283 stop:1450 length:168 start_codon:yes stop_codon:yes gene_type:complete
MKLIVTEKERELMIQALADHGKVYVEREKNSKLSRDDKKKLKSIENIISQIAFGN